MTSLTKNHSSNNEEPSIISQLAISQEHSVRKSHEGNVLKGAIFSNARGSQKINSKMNPLQPSAVRMGMVSFGGGQARGTDLDRGENQYNLAAISQNMTSTAVKFMTNNEEKQR